MSVLRWNEATREELSGVLPEALVVLPVGATEQHGPHLATGTDALLADTVASRAVARAGADCARDLVLAPTIPVGASDHHLPFGGTLSLSPETLQAVLVDLARSVAAGGGRRLVIVNGHGGNRGVCHSAAAAASTRSGLAVAYLDYWALLNAGDDPRVPGHAGEFETSMVLAVRPELVRPRAARDEPRWVPVVRNVDIYSGAVWQGIEGYTDDPARADAEQGNAWLDHCVSALSDRLIDLATTL